MSEKLMVLNVNKGGHKSYEATRGQIPEREKAIKELVRAQYNEGVNTVVLLDTFLWRDMYDNPDSEDIEAPGIADHLGFRAAFHTSLDDPTLNAKGREKVGITVATELDVNDPFVARIGKSRVPRNALVMQLQSDSGIFDLGAAYLSEDSASARWRQATDLESIMHGESILPPRDPSIIAGDINELSPHEWYSGSQARYSKLVHGLAAATQNLDIFGNNFVGKKLKYVKNTLESLDNRRIIEYMRTRDYYDLNAGPTYYPPRMPVPMLDPDHILHRGMQVLNKYTVGDRSVSDHKGLVMEFDILPLDKQ